MPASGSLPDRRATRVRLALALIVAAGAGLRLLAMRRTPADRSGPPLMDDAFYYFSLGRNLASGAGFRVDAEHLTTGFQPLWGLLNALPYWLTPQAPIAGAQGMGLVVGLATVMLLHHFVSRLSGVPAAGLAAALLFAAAPPAVVMSVSGMETGLAVLAALLHTWAVHEVFTRRTAEAVAIAGLAGGAAFLARVDLLILAATTGLLLVVMPPLAGRWRTAAIYATCCCAPILPWIGLTAFMGRPPLPESGAAVRLIATLMEPEPGIPAARGFAREAARFAGRAAGDLHLLLPIDPMLVRDAAAETLTPASGLAAALLIVLAGMARRRVDRVLLAIATVQAALMLVAYAGFIGAEWNYPRYAIPMAEIFTALAIALVARRVAAAPDPPRRWLRRGAVAYLVATIGWCALLAVASQRYGWLGGPAARVATGPDGYVETSRWLNAHLASNVRVGVFQSGLIGYRATMPVINLDGKVNAEARRAMAAGTMWDYVCAAKIDVIADWPYVIERLLIQRSRDWRLERLETMTTIPRGDGASEWIVVRVHRDYCPATGT